jgi:hypothetical protein
LCFIIYHGCAIVGCGLKNGLKEMMDSNNVMDVFLFHTKLNMDGKDEKENGDVTEEVLFDNNNIVLDEVFYSALSIAFLYKVFFF